MIRTGQYILEFQRSSFLDNDIRVYLTAVIKDSTSADSSVASGTFFTQQIPSTLK